MRVPVLKQGAFLIASVQDGLTDNDLLKLREELAEKVGEHRSQGVVIDVSALDVLDSFATRVLRNIAHATRLRGAETVVAGIQPDVAFAMVQLGLGLDGIATALDLDEAIELLQRKLRRKEGARARGPARG
ncbi:MAG: STAS domain-containing protein [Deltaproteobacteria bacterium]|nr:STAS domain-containing protein [Deltaproteobacteria bacterium]